jgi:hypothetical protein
MAGESDLDVTEDWYWEGNVVEAIARFLANTLDDRQQGRHALAFFADAKTAPIAQGFERRSELPNRPLCIRFYDLALRTRFPG